MKPYGYHAKNDSLFAAKEAYRTIRANLMFSVPRAGCKTLMFTSSVQGEGKTTTAVNVAISLARGDQKVLLIDMDFRRPRVNRLMKLPVKPGLTNYLSGFNSLQEIIKPQVFPNLDLIPAGSTSPNPAEMMASEGVRSLLKELQEHYDFIIIDTPPVNVVSDALPLMKHCDGVMLVIRPMYTSRNAVQKCLQQVELIGAKILGVVANGVISSKRGSRRYGYSGYAGYAAYAGEQTAKERDSEE